jgi:hypothetical protein
MRLKHEQARKPAHPVDVCKALQGGDSSASVQLRGGTFRARSKFV